MRQNRTKQKKTSHLANSSVCKARKEKCHACTKRGHVSSVCSSRNQLREGTETPSSDTEETEDVLGVQQKKLAHKSGVWVTLTVEGRHLMFLMDTGLSIPIINTDIYLDNFVSQQLKPAAVAATINVNASR